MFSLTNFKSFKKAEIDLSKPFTILIGPNGSGKSNLIEGIELISYIAQGYPLHEITEVGRGGKLQIRGGLNSTPRFGGVRAFYLGVTHLFTLNSLKRYWIYVVGISNSEVRLQPQVMIEEFRNSDETIIFSARGESEKILSNDINVKYNSFDVNEEMPIVSVSGNRSILSQYKEFAWQNNKNYQECIKLIQNITDYLGALFVLDLNPKAIRKYERMNNNILSKNGENLSAVLYSLHRGNEEQKQTLNRLLNLIKQIPEEPYEKFDFITTQLDDVVFGLKHAGTGQLINAFILSDGTLRTLAVLTALETVAEGSLIIIEEFDNGLHPSRLDILVKAIDECSRRRKLNVLVTTHNPATLNALEAEQLDGVVFCTWNKEKQASELIKLKDLPRYDQLLERGRLGDLITRRIVERYFNPDFEEEYKKKSLEWLRSIA